MNSNVINNLIVKISIPSFILLFRFPNYVTFNGVIEYFGDVVFSLYDKYKVFGEIFLLKIYSL